VLYFIKRYFESWGASSFIESHHDVRTSVQKKIDRTFHSKMNRNVHEKVNKRL